MELRHLRYFTAVAKHLNLSEASRRPTRHGNLRADQRDGFSVAEHFLEKRRRGLQTVITPITLDL